MGFVIDVMENAILFDITEWEKRNDTGGSDDPTYGYRAILTEDTVIKRENGELILISEIKEKQVAVILPLRSMSDDLFEGVADEIIFLDEK
ncbi:hypothetical protein BACCIP111883_01198 [Sutcliffiella rhizosphaerae]|uniref:Uncharacterized protein n=2 Tax=Sutcliffiella rhizosphaerae TaxID=2880967 RepID=A0ABM8YKF3_9BACI|nr:hypothetical protein BACCIP111883_01198 [Sutcliffiella rhizosphaerae]